MPLTLKSTSYPDLTSYVELDIGKNRKENEDKEDKSSVRRNMRIVPFYNPVDTRNSSVSTAGTTKIYQHDNAGKNQQIIPYQRRSSFVSDQSLNLISKRVSDALVPFVTSSVSNIVKPLNTSKMSIVKHSNPIISKATSSSLKKITTEGIESIPKSSSPTSSNPPKSPKLTSRIKESIKKAEQKSPKLTDRMANGISIKNVNLNVTIENVILEQEICQGCTRVKSNIESMCCNKNCCNKNNKPRSKSEPKTLKRVVPKEKTVNKEISSKKILEKVKLTEPVEIKLETISSPDLSSFRHSDEKDEKVVTANKDSKKYGCGKKDCKCYSKSDYAEPDLSSFNMERVIPRTVIDYSYEDSDCDEHNCAAYSAKIEGCSDKNCTNCATYGK